MNAAERRTVREELSRELPRYLTAANLENLIPYTYVRLVDNLPPHIGAEWHRFIDTKENSIRISTRRSLDIKKRSLAHEIAHMEIEYSKTPYVRWIKRFFHILFWVIPFYGTRNFGSELFVHAYATTKILAKTNPELLELHRVYTHTLIRKNTPKVVGYIICMISDLLIRWGKGKVAYCF